MKNKSVLCLCNEYRFGKVKREVCDLCVFICMLVYNMVKVKARGCNDQI